MYSARLTASGSISIDGNGENFNYNLKIPGMTIDEINDLLRNYNGKDPVAYLKSKETEMYDKMADFDGEENGETLEKKIYVKQEHIEFVSWNSGCPKCGSHSLDVEQSADTGACFDCGNKFSKKTGQSVK